LEIVTGVKFSEHEIESIVFAINYTLTTIEDHTLPIETKLTLKSIYSNLKELREEDYDLAGVIKKNLQIENMKFLAS
jgi:hypothetical protein